MIEFLVILFWCIVALTVGFGLLKLFATFIANSDSRSPYQIVESEISAAQLARRNQRVEILNQIHNAPKCPDGTYTDWQKMLWDNYHALEVGNEKITQKEHDALMRASR